MSFFVIRLRYLALGTAAVIAILVSCFGMGHVTEVFNSGERKIPIYSVERSDNAVSITFDCAWNDNDIDAILDTLDKYDCQATFFAVGTWAQKYPDALKKIAARGHEIGSHSYNHDDYTSMDAEEIIADMDKCDDIIESITGNRPTLMRAPSGGYNNTVISACESTGRTYIQWSVDTIDYKAASAEEITERAVKNTSSGDIILLHNGTEYTKDALDGLLDTLSKQYTFLPVSELIYKENFTIDHTGRQVPAKS